MHRRTIALALVASAGASSCHPDSASDSDHGDRAALEDRATPLSQALYESLARSPATTAWEGKTWELTRDNQVPASWLLATPGGTLDELAVPGPCTPGASGCDADFARFTCEDDADCGAPIRCQPLRATKRAPEQAPARLCLGHSDFLVDRVYEVITSAESFVDVTSLIPPTGRFLAAARNALAVLDTKHRDIEVRMLFGNYPTAFVDSEATLADLTRGLPASTRVHVTVGAYRSSFTSWNHAKIVAADGQRAIVGGHNLWDADYLNEDPVTDVSMQLEGSAAASAQRYANLLWDYTCGDTWSATTSHAVSSNTGASCAPVFRAERAAGTGGVPVLAIGRLGEAGDSNASDQAIVTALTEARTALRISAQDLGPAYAGPIPVADWPRPVLAALAAALVRGVEVYLVQTNPGAVGPSGQSYSFGWGAADLGQQIVASVAALGYRDPRRLACEHLHVAPIRLGAGDTWPDGVPFANHSKVIVVDERAFYIGSQNLYVSNLAEYGYVVDDAAATRTLLTELWEPLWARSQAAAVSGAGVATCAL